MEEDKNLQIDPALTSFNEVIRAVTSLQTSVEAPEIFEMILQKVEIKTPLELDVYTSEDGRVTLGTAPPIYHLRTTDEPVFHSLTTTIIADGNQE